MRPRGESRGHSSARDYKHAPRRISYYTVDSRTRHAPRTPRKGYYREVRVPEQIGPEHLA